MTTLFIVIRFYSIYIYWVVYFVSLFVILKRILYKVYYNILSNILLPYRSIFVDFLEFLNKILECELRWNLFLFFAMAYSHGIVHKLTSTLAREKCCLVALTWQEMTLPARLFT